VPQRGSSKFNRHEFDSFIWKAAGSLRGYLSSEDVENYILSFLFFKFVSDSWDLEHTAIVTDRGGAVVREAGADYYRFIVPDGSHWDDLKGAFYPGVRLQESLDALAAANSERFSDLFRQAARANWERLPNSVMFDLIHSLDQFTLNRSIVSAEGPGAIFEHAIRQFADVSGKRAGAIVTPRGVVRLLARILSPQPGETVYDPACGTGGLLIGVAKELQETGNSALSLRLYGQETNSSAVAIAQMNLVINGLDSFRIIQGNTLLYPGFLEQSKLQKFDAVIANPPFSLKNWGADYWISDPFGRAFCGVPPANTADLAWIQHSIASMNNDTGRVGIVIPYGALSRTGAERSIRECLINHDPLEAVIGLPSNLFFGTSIPVCLLVFRARKSIERRNAVIFADASTCYTKSRNRNYIEDKQAKVISAAYRNGMSEVIPTRIVARAEISTHDWDLNPSRYLKPPAPDHAAFPASQSEQSIDAETEMVAPGLSTQELGEICEVLPGRNRAARNEDEDSEFRLIRAEDIRSTLAAWSDLPLSNHRKATSVEVAPGDIIGSISGPYGRWAVVPEEYGPALASDHTVVLKSRTAVSMWYLLGFLRSAPGRELIKGTQRGTVISRISPTDLKRIQVPDCPLPSDYVDPVLKSFEEEHRRLQRGIEELYNRFNTVYESDLPVEVMARLDVLQGITASMREITDLGRGVAGIARTSYPYPIARNLRAIGNASSWRERYHEVTQEAPEILSVILTCICAAVARETATRGGQATRRWIRAVGRGGATIGTRNAMIFELASHLITSDGPGDIGGIGRALGQPGAPAVALMRKLLQERNRIHGDYPRTDIQFEQRLAESESEMWQLLEALGLLARWELRYAESVEPLEGEHDLTFFSVKFRVLRGDNPDWEIAEYASQSPLYRGRVYALVDDQSLFDLYPFLLVRACQLCGALEVYHPASFSDDEVNLVSIDRGHSQVTSDARLLSAVQAAFV
jgi:type I restriction enzyme M protein